MLSFIILFITFSYKKIRFLNLPLLPYYRLIGEPAKRQAVTNAEKTISSIKRHMGEEYKVAIDDKKYSPQEISAMILSKLKADAESYLGGARHQGHKPKSFGWRFHPCQDHKQEQLL